MPQPEIPPEATEPLKRKGRALGLWPSAIIGSVVGCAFFLGGYLLVVGDQQSYASVMFILVPFVSGFAIAAVTRKGVLVGACCITTLIVSLLVLIAAGLEGYICCMMALPFLLVGMLIGGLFGYFVRGRFLELSPNPKRDTTLLMIVAPLVLVSADQIERPFRSVPRIETFVTAVEIEVTPDVTWQHLVQMQRMDGNKPFLLRIGLPVPHHCTLEKESVGAKRVCFFDQGVIRQEVTEWDRPMRMAVATTESTLPGRRWLTFKDANYELSPTVNGTLVTRRTMIGSKLYPRWYWRPFEAWGVESEHEFVLTSLKRAAEANQ